MWLKNFFQELKAWRIVRNVCIKNKKTLSSVGLKMDWFGRLYIVINRDPEIVLGSEEDEAYLHKELATIWSILVSLNIVDILAYELKPLDNERILEDGNIEYDHAYLVTFTPAYNLDRQYVTWKSVLGLSLCLIGIISLITYLILNANW